MNQADIFAAGATRLQMIDSTEMTMQSLIIEGAPIYVPVNLNPRIEAIVCIFDFPRYVAQQLGKLFAEGFARLWIAKRSSILSVIKGDEGTSNLTACLCQLERTVTTKRGQRHKFFNVPNIDFHEVLFCLKNYIGRMVYLRIQIQIRNCAFYQYGRSHQAKNHCSGAEMRSSLLSQYVASRLSCCKTDSAEERANGANRPDPVGPLCHSKFGPRNSPECKIYKTGHNCKDDRPCNQLPAWIHRVPHRNQRLPTYEFLFRHHYSNNSWLNGNTMSVGGGK